MAFLTILGTAIATAIAARHKVVEPERFGAVRHSLPTSLIDRLHGMPDQSCIALGRSKTCPSCPAVLARAMGEDSGTPSPTSPTSPLSASAPARTRLSPRCGRPDRGLQLSHATARRPAARACAHGTVHQPTALAETARPPASKGKARSPSRLITDTNPPPKLGNFRCPLLRNLRCPLTHAAREACRRLVSPGGGTRRAELRSATG